MSAIGPQLPPHLSSKSSTNECCEEQENKDIGPQLPTSSSRCSNEKLVNEKKTYGPALPPCYDDGRKVSKEGTSRIVGPMLPKHLLGSAEEEDDGGEIIGPMFPGHTKSDDSDQLKAQFEARAEAMKNKLTHKTDDKNLQRESWMLELPPEIGKNFGLGPRTFRSKAVDLGDRSVWTDTPADREKKLLDKKSLAGEKRKVTTDEVRVPAPEELEIHKHISEYNKQTRPQSLLEMHRSKQQKTETGKSSYRPFDRDQDLALHRKDPKAKAKFIEGAKQMNAKFSAGNYESKFL